MASNFWYSVNAIVPIVLLVVLGFVLRRIGFLTDAFTAVGESVVFKAALPALLFLEVAGGDLSTALSHGSLVLYCVVTVTAAFLFSALIVPLFLKNKRQRGAFVQGMCRSNFAVLGVPLAENMFGDSGLETVAVVMPFVILMFNAYSVVLLSAFEPKEERETPGKTALSILKNIVTNPLIIAVILALPLMIWHLELPTVLDKSIGYLGNLATPLALLCLGANFKPETIRGNLRCVVCASLGKTVLLPAIFVTLAALLGFRNESLGVILILFGAPSAVSSYIMARKMNSDAELAAQIMLVTTVICVFTIFAGIFVLRTLRLI